MEMCLTLHLKNWPLFYLLYFKAVVFWFVALLLITDPEYGASSSSGWPVWHTIIILRIYLWVHRITWMWSYIFIIHILLLIIKILTQFTTNKKEQQISVKNSCFDLLSLLLHSINEKIRSDTFMDLIGNIFLSVLIFVFCHWRLFDGQVPYLQVLIWHTWFCYQNAFLTSHIPSYLPLVAVL